MADDSTQKNLEALDPAFAAAEVDDTPVGTVFVPDGPYKLDALRALQAGWDGDDAVPISEQAISMAEWVLNSRPRAVPQPDGGVCIEWPNGFEMTITADGTQALE